VGLLSENGYSTADRIGAEQQRRGGGTRRRHGIKGGVTSVRRVRQRRLLQLPNGSASPPAHTHTHTYGTSVCGYHPPPPARIRADTRRSHPAELWTVIGDASSPRIVDLSLGLGPRGPWPADYTHHHHQTVPSRPSSGTVAASAWPPARAQAGRNKLRRWCAQRGDGYREDVDGEGEAGVDEVRGGGRG
jgi:hypothetical protein